MSETIRAFETGATRSADTGRDDPEGYLSPLVIARFNEYMTKHRVQPDGGVRASDNWQKGMPLAAYMKSAWRHFLHWWTRHRGWTVQDPKAGANIEDDLCALMFNVAGYLHEYLKAKLETRKVLEPLVGMSETAGTCGCKCFPCECPPNFDEPAVLHRDLYRL